ncbi:4-hydroxybenzoate transporter PcaK [Pigmentiphaga humi]|uniref:4-hydroxybenzoate transporter PcaK n=1 Tax=Pigmentiphaga humi TaxID=2478468 RepID=A0A3P4B3I1_9BURK|nr:MFS transporter [Pigmentiphaga humi]VCU70857.1 4-hydroxybenzoate transporter PcaK [Pigmentiphaga humi]
MTDTRSLNVQQFINTHRFSSTQIVTLLLCFLIVAVDGFDTASIGFIAPAIRDQWNLDPAHLAPVFGAGLFGLMIGALAFGPMADRVGRKTTLLVCTGVFGLASLVSAWSPSLEFLTVLRFLTGLGLGGAMPNAITLSSEYAPDKHRSVLVTTMFCGFTMGSALGGILAAYLVDHLGWHAVLLVGGIVPLALLPLLAWRLPESVRYMVVRGHDPQRISRILQRIAPDADLRDVRYDAEAAPAGSPVRQLFDPQLRRGTLLLWVMFFMCMLIIYLLSSWLPTLIKNTGRSLQDASLVTAMFQVGGTVGAITLGRLMDSFNPQRVLAIAYVVGAAFIAMIGHGAASTVLLVLAVTVAGFCASGGQVGANALAAGFYPTPNRATGVAWALGIGRIGSIVGSMSGGWMLTAGWGMEAVFEAVAVPAVVAAVAVVLMGRGRQAA